MSSCFDVAFVLFGAEVGVGVLVDSLGRAGFPCDVELLLVVNQVCTCRFFLAIVGVPLYS